MKELFLKKAEIIGFKGIQNLTVNLSKNTIIEADNRKGKTTIVDSIYWCMFGKNSEDQQKFSVKTLDENNNVIPDIEHSVKLTWMVDGKEKSFKRGVEEKYIKPHGQAERVYKGDESLFWINDVPMQKKEFDFEVEQIISASLFKLLSSPVEFNRIAWEDRRKVLIEIAGGIKDSDVISSLDLPKSVIEAITDNRFDRFKQELSAKLKPLKEELKQMPVRISEALHNMPESLNWKQLQTDLDDLNKKVSTIDEQIENVAKSAEQKANEQSKLIDQIAAIKQQMQELKHKKDQEANAGFFEKENELNKLKGELSVINSNLESKKSDIAKLEKENETLSNQRAQLIVSYKSLKQLTFQLPDGALNCPTCGHALENADEKRIELEGNFNKDKAERLDKNVTEGKRIASEIESNTNQIAKLKVELSDIEEKRDELNKKIASFKIERKEINVQELPEFKQMAAEIAKLDKKKEAIEMPSTKELRMQKHELTNQIDEIKTQLQIKTKIEEKELRHEELKQQQKLLANEIAELEQLEYAAKEFEDAKISLVEQRVNSKFNFCKFSMFEKQKNGEMRDNCITLINGVPYSDANTESKINAGVEICNVLQQFHKIKAPIIVDNRESVSELVQTDTQIINLFKVTGLDELRITNE